MAKQPGRKGERVSEPRDAHAVLLICCMRDFDEMTWEAIGKFHGSSGANAQMLYIRWIEWAKAQKGYRADTYAKVVKSMNSVGKRKYSAWRKMFEVAA